MSSTSHSALNQRPRGGIPRLRPGSIALLSYGFRLFFLAAALWAVAAMVLWIGLLSGQWAFAKSYGAVAWHAHEFLFGYVSAVLTGFLLTAIPNWTGRLPLQGRALLALFSLWMVGRAAMLASDRVGMAAIIIDCAYLPALLAVILREIMAGANRRNLKVAMLVAVVALANVVFQIEVAVSGAPDYGLRLGCAAIVGLIVAAGIRDQGLKRDVIRLITPVGLLGGLFAVMMFLYYLQTVPDNARIMLGSHLLPQYATGMVAVAAVTTVYLLFSWLKPQYVRVWLAVPAFLFIAIVGVWPEERMRESMRKPFVAGQYIYGNQVIARDVPGKRIVGKVDEIAEKGYLKLHPFIPDRLRVITDDNRREVGELLTKIACANCHALEPGAPLRALPDKLHRATDKDLIAAFIAGPLKHGAVPYMPRIDLPETEIDAIATFLADVNQKAATHVSDVRRVIAGQPVQNGSD